MIRSAIVAADIGARTLAGVAVVGLVLVVLPLALIALVGAPRQRRRHLTRARAWERASQMVADYVQGPTRDAAGALRVALDDGETRECALRAIASGSHGASEVDRRSLVQLVLDSKANTWLLKELSSRNRHHVVRALDHVRALQLESFTGHVVTMLDDRRPSVRRAAAQALVQLDPLLATVTLPDRLHRDGPWVAECLVDAMAAAHSTTLDVRTRPSLLRHLPGLVLDLRDGGEDDVYISALIGMSSFQSEPLRLAAITALGSSGHRAALTYLFGALQSTDPLVRSAAAAGLVRHPSGVSLLRSVAENENDSAALLARSVLWVFSDDIDLAAALPATSTELEV